MPEWSLTRLGEELGRIFGVEVGQAVSKKLEEIGKENPMVGEEMRGELERRTERLLRSIGESACDVQAYEDLREAYFRVQEYGKRQMGRRAIQGYSLDSEGGKRGEEEDAS